MKSTDLNQGVMEQQIQFVDLPSDSALLRNVMGSSEACDAPSHQILWKSVFPQWFHIHSN